jgi:hypothetical protein
LSPHITRVSPHANTQQHRPLSHCATACPRTSPSSRRR